MFFLVFLICLFLYPNPSFATQAPPFKCNIIATTLDTNAPLNRITFKVKESNETDTKSVPNCNSAIGNSITAIIDGQGDTKNGESFSATLNFIGDENYSQYTLSNIKKVVITQSPSPTPTVSNDNLFTQYKNDYFFQRDLYTQIYINYQNKVQKNTQYGSVVTQKEKTDATKSVLISRNKMLKTYSVALRVLLDKYKNFNSTDTQKLQIQLSKWENWFDEQNTIVDALNNDSDINKWAQTFTDNYIQIQVDTTAALIQHEVNLKTAILENFKTLATEIQSKPEIYHPNQQWFNSLPVKYDLINKSLKNSLSYSQKPQNNKFSDFYPDAKADLGIANGYITDVINDLKLIVSKSISN